MVLVTGGAKGIGRMISEGFVANGAKVYVSSRDGKACEKAAEELTARGTYVGESRTGYRGEGAPSHHGLDPSYAPDRLFCLGSLIVTHLCVTVGAPRLLTPTVDVLASHSHRWNLGCLPSLLPSYLATLFPFIIRTLISLSGPYFAKLTTNP